MRKLKLAVGLLVAWIFCLLSGSLFTETAFASVPKALPYVYNGIIYTDVVGAIVGSDEEYIYYTSDGGSYGQTDYGYSDYLYALDSATHTMPPAHWAYFYCAGGTCPTDPTDVNNGAHYSIILPYGSCWYTPENNYQSSKDVIERTGTNNGYGGRCGGYNPSAGDIDFTANVQTGNQGGFKLPDTGQTTCYDAAGNVITCPPPGDPMAQDGSYPINPLSYTDNGDGTVTDNNTGLIWQKYHDKNYYTWYVASGTYDAIYNQSSQNICGSLSLGGFSDWRLPTKKELMSIVDYGICPGPVINPAYFPDTSGTFWTSTTLGLYPDSAFYVGFDGGDFSVYPKSFSNFFVRCVRGRQLPSQSFVDNGNSTVTDNNNGLMWQQGEPGLMTWDSSLSYCEGLSLSGHSDWRLPNFRELDSITDTTRWRPAIDTDYFPHASASVNYWSSTSLGFGPGAAWSENFQFGSSSFGYNKNTNYNVRCVRGGGSTPPPSPTCLYTYSDWGACQPDNTQTRTVISSLPVGCVGTPILSRSCTNLTVNLTGSGTITSSPAGLTCSGNVCTGSFPQGTSVTLTASSNGGWKFGNWDDGIANYNQNPWTITMDANKAITATFVWNDKISLAPVDSTPLGNRTPLILVHGNHMEMETKTQFGWNNYIKAFRKDSGFQRQYKVYLFSWDSEQPNTYNGMAMGSMIDSLPELQNKNLTILAHSRGGLVTRYFMNQYTMQNGNHNGQLGGEKVKWLVTLATPHRGTPGADPIWVGISLDYNFSNSTELFLSDLYFTDLLPPRDRVYDPQSYPNLLWDDVDNELTTKAVCYNPALNGEVQQCTPLMSKTILNDLSKFNQNEHYFNKIIAYGGNNYSMMLDFQVKLMLGINPEMILILSDHQKLGWTTVLMERMPIIPPGNTSVPNNPQLPFKANDGMVPLASALFLKHDASGLFQFNKNKFSYDKALLKNSFCQIAECNVVDGTVDHQSFLDNSTVISTILMKLDRLH